MSREIAVTGLAELGKFLEQLGPKIAKNVARGAMRAGANVVLHEARRLAPEAAPSARNARRYGGFRGALRKSLRVSTRSRGMQVTASVKSGDEVAYYARWVEYGTREHFITVDPKVRPSRWTRRGIKIYSIRTLNRMAARGSLKIGSAFVGSSVKHPGAKPRRFMRPALDTKAAAAVVAAGEYMKARLATKHGLETADISIGAEE